MNKSFFKSKLLFVPKGLVWMRVILAPFLLLITDNSVLFLIIFILAFLSDIFDGVIARKMNIVTSDLRVMDSYADILLYLCVMIGILLRFSELVKPLIPVFIVVVLLQLINWGISLKKFGKLTSYHSYLAKIRGLILFAAIISIFAFNYAGIFWGSAILAIISNIEGIIISLILPKWSFDVWSINDAIKRRRTILPD